MGTRPIPPFPLPPDPRVTPQSIHGNLPLSDRQRAYQLELAKLQKAHDQQRQEIERAYQLELSRIPLHERPIPVAPDDLPGYIKAKPEPSHGALGEIWYFNWRHLVAFWIILDLIGIGVALYLTLSVKPF